MGGVVGFVLWKGVGGTSGILFGGFVALCGLILGIMWATRIWKKQGTSTFMSRVNASPDLDNLTTQDSFIIYLVDLTDLYQVLH